MAWNDTAREEYKRTGSGYPSDMTDREWAIIEPVLPPAKRGGRPRTTDLRKVMNAILYIASSGCQWRMLPRDFPPVSTVRVYFYAWRNMGLWSTINQLLVMSLREIEGREASASAGVIDSQSIKTTESGGICGYDAGKKVKGRKRHIITDTLGLIPVATPKALLAHIVQNMQRHRHQEFTRFLNRIEREVPADKAIHVILDNYAAHKKDKVQEWLARHPRWTFHFTPTSCSWLNAVEGFFAKLTRRRLKNGVFHSLVDLQAAINRFIREYNANDPKPFVWKADPDEIIAARNRGFQTLESIHQ